METTAQRLAPKVDIESDRFEIDGIALVHMDVAFNKNTLIGYYSNGKLAQLAKEAHELKDNQVVYLHRRFWNDDPKFVQ